MGVVHQKNYVAQSQTPSKGMKIAVCINICEYDGEKYTQGQIYSVNAGMFGGTMHYWVNKKEVNQDFFKKIFKSVVKPKTTAKKR